MGKIYQKTCLRKKSRSERILGGFTLVELLVVVLIVGILAAVALPHYEVAMAESRYASVMPLLAHYKQAQEMHFLRHGKYAETWKQLNISLPPGAKLAAENIFWTNKIYGWSISSKRVFVTLGGRVKGLEYSISLAHSSTPNSRYCIAYDLNPLAVRVCENLGGVPHHTGQGNQSAYTAYLLP